MPAMREAIDRGFQTILVGTTYEPGTAIWSREWEKFSAHWVILGEAYQILDNRRGQESIAARDQISALLVDFWRLKARAFEESLASGAVPEELDTADHPWIDVQGEKLWVEAREEDEVTFYKIYHSTDSEDNTVSFGILNTSRRVDPARPLTIESAFKGPDLVAYIEREEPLRTQRIVFREGRIETFQTVFPRDMSNNGAHSEKVVTFRFSA